MHSQTKMVVSALLALSLIAVTTASGHTQGQQHAVSSADLRRDLTRSAEMRQTNEADIRALFSSETGQKALKSAHLDYEKVDKAIGQLSDEELAKLAQSSRQIQADFAAGRISNGGIIAIVCVIAAVIILVVLFSQLNHS